MERRTAICGIGGIIRFGGKSITEEQISLMLTGNEARGNDATGIALSQESGKVIVYKSDIPAWQFARHKDYYAFIEQHLKPDTWGALLHTRAATQGNPRDNNNNHPLFAGGAAIIHNGVLQNDTQLFQSQKFERKAETDSDILRAFVDKYGVTDKCIKEMNRIVGSAAGAAFDPRYPQKLLLFRSGSPMVLGSTEDFFMFASEKGTLYRAMRPYVKRWNMWFQRDRMDLAFSPMADNTAWIVGAKGQESHKEFKTLCGKYVDPYRRTFEGYVERQKKWDGGHKPTGPVNRTMDEAWCPECLKPWVIPQGGDATKFHCPKDHGGCGTTLIAAKPAKKDFIDQAVN